MLKRVKLWKQQTVLLVKNIFESILYHMVKERGPVGNPEKIVFVCTGNICRSAFAEKLLKNRIGIKTPVVESCGLFVEVCSPSPHQAVLAAEKIGLNLGSHLSKGIGCCDMESADLILAMEYWQYRKLVRLLPGKRRNIRLLREFCPFPENLLCNIYDPFGLSQNHFEHCFAQIQRSVATIRSLIL